MPIPRRTICFRATSAEERKLQKLQEKLGISQTAVIHQALKKFADDHGIK